MARKQIKEAAQVELMNGMVASFTMATDRGASSEVLDEMSKQMARVEKLFGYEAYSWGRGGTAPKG